MGLTAGIVGLPNVGKSTLFNAITKNSILAANYPFATIDPNVGVVTVPDERLEKLNEMYEPKQKIPTAFEFTDIAGLVKGASQGEGLGNKFLSHIRETDAIVEVVRCFENKDIIHVEGTIDPIRDIEIISLELILADLESIGNRIEKMGKKARTSKVKEDLIELEALEKAKKALEENHPLRMVDFTIEEKKALKSYNFLTMKPIIYLANIDEEELTEIDNPYVKKVEEYASRENSKVIKVCAKIEEELSQLDESDKKEMLQALGIPMSGLDQLIKATYDLLGLATYFTVGKDEVRAWTFRKGMNAKECAGIIHTDFEKGFIRAEVISYTDLIELGSEQKVKEAGKARLEGKDYLMQDGDICHFRFNV
ncbi:MAG TPA: redox-regulated ATPase YchF [Candidatus Scybalousia intestinigallinarum]|nr:redox-regulated ATPase YchF [Candidatus Scybalousia intestinigallinarum]